MSSEVVTRCDPFKKSCDTKKSHVVHFAYNMLSLCQEQSWFIECVNFNFNISQSRVTCPIISN